jgi:hypothetical protein
MLYAKTLDGKLNNTLEALASLNKKEPSGSKTANWCSTSTWLRGLEKAAAQLEGDPLFNDIVEALQLRGDLLAV